jgi:formylglycine-generating enzyme required for sulfatase activity/class 3 adenylate cyclase
MVRTSPYLDEKLANKNATCNMQVVFVDIVSYSKRKAHAQVEVIEAFMASMEQALTDTARQYLGHLTKNDLNLRRDIVVLPAGDGAAIGFPFDGIHDMHLSFARHLFKVVDRFNRRSKCTSFREDGWCDCHGAFLLRCGVSEGKLIIYKDLNGNYNIAGEAVNMAARVMGRADGNQVFFTERGYVELADLVKGVDRKFRKYVNVEIKHNLRITVYQYIEEGQVGIDVSPRADLESVQVTDKSKDLEATQPASIDREKDAVVRSNTSRQRGVSTQTLAIGSSSGLDKEMQSRMVPVPAGEFLLGDDQTGRVQVKIPQSFLIDKYPLTQGIYERVMNTNPSHFKGNDRPVETVSWRDALAFCNTLTLLFGLDPVYDISGEEVTIDLRKNGYRLPNEAEWEYACLGGNDQERYGPIDRIAWYNKNSESQTQPVGRMDPNSFGLFDMLGNVCEWCNDRYEQRHSPSHNIGYMGPPSSPEHVARGGSWKNLSNNISSKSRFRWQPMIREDTLGFRVVRGEQH